LSLKHLARHPEAAFSCMPLTCFPDEGADRIGEDGPWWSSEARYFAPAELTAMSTHGSIHGNTVVIDREAFLAAGGLLPHLEWRSDWFCNWVAAFRRGLVHIPSHSALVRLSAGQYSAGMADPARDARVVAELLRTLHEPAYRDVREAFLASDVLFPLDLASLVLGLEPLGLDAAARGFLRRRAERELHRGAPALRRLPDPRCTQAYLEPRIAELVQEWNRDGLRVALFGAGEHTGHLFKWTELAGADLLAIADNNPQLHGKRFWGLEVVPPWRLLELIPDVVLVSSAVAQKEIAAQLRAALPPWTRLELLYPEASETPCVP
jgi:hypothetical protein